MMTKNETILRSEKLENVFIFIYTLQFDMLFLPGAKKKFRSAVYLLHLIYTVLQLDGYPGFDAAEAAHMLLNT